MAGSRDARIQVGRISGLFGVKGWVRVFSYTEPRDNIVRYSPWHVLRASGEQIIEVTAGQLHGGGVVAKLHGVDDRDAATALIGTEIEVGREHLDPLPAGEYYWTQLSGLEVVDEKGRVFGKVDHLLRTGANDVLVVEGERQRLIPFVQGAVIKEIDLDAGVMRVDWAPDY